MIYNKWWCDNIKKQYNSRMNYYTPKKIVRNEFGNVYRDLKKLNGHIALIKKEGVNEENYRVAFRTVRELKQSLDNLSGMILSSGHSAKYWRLLDYFKMRYGFLKKLTYDFWRSMK